MKEYYSKYKNPSCTNGDISVDSNLREQSHRIILCEKWIYDFDFLHGYKSMTSELNWVCGNAHKSINGQAMYFIGSVVGTFTLGIFADIYGRLPILIAAHSFGIIGNFLTIFSRDVISFAISRFISGCATDNNFVMMYILVLEYISPKMRTKALNMCIGVFYCLGSMISPWIAGCTRWKLKKKIILQLFFSWQCGLAHGSFIYGQL